MQQGHNDQNSICQKTCKECDYKCISEDDLKYHMNVKHIIDSKNSTSDCEEYPEVDDEELDEWVAKAAKAAESQNE